METILRSKLDFAIKENNRLHQKINQLYNDIIQLKYGVGVTDRFSVVDNERLDYLVECERKLIELGVSLNESRTA